MADALGYEALVAALRAAAAKVKSAGDDLSRLDAAIGDGDHGVAMTRAMSALEKGIDECGGRTPKELLQAVALSVMSIDAGSTGPLMGSLFLGLAEGAGDGQVDAARLAAMFEAGLKQIRSISQAQLGDKTMLDALVPAVEALREAATRGTTAAEALNEAAAAAEAGAQKTKDYPAKFGKARNLGQRSLGHQDPGATSMAVLIRGLADGAAGT